MSSKTRIGIVEFGKHLIVTGDLDPVYIALHNMREDGDLDNDQLSKWLISYWCFYSCGIACHMSGIPDSNFWREMKVAAKNEQLSPTGNRWERGSERRHFRGSQGLASVCWMEERFPRPHDLVWKHIIGPGVDHEAGFGEWISYSKIAAKIREIRGFGEWMAFKAADMSERLGLVNIAFDEDEVMMYEAPTAGALLSWATRHGQKPPAIEELNPATKAEILRKEVAWLKSELGHLSAPPGHERKLNIQELETVFCKWKSHMNGHYPLMHDIDEIKENLAPWAKVNWMAEDMLLAEPFGEE